MIEQYTLARPYAKAIFTLAQQSQSFALWSEFLGMCMQLLAKFGNARALQAGVGSMQRAAFLQDIGNMPLSSEQENVLKLLLRRKKLRLLAQIAFLYERMRADYEGRLTAQVIAAFPLTDEQKQQIVLALKRKFNREIILETAINPALIGGAVIHVNDQVIDGSVVGMLKRAIKN